MAEKAFVYIRVSTTEQAEAGTSLFSQMTACEAYCKSKGYTIVGQSQDDISGATSLYERPGLTKALHSEASVIVCYDVDRLTRNNLQYALTLNEFEKVGKRFEFSTGGSTGNSDNDKLISGFKSLVAEFERSKILARTSEGRKQSARNGNIVTSWTPFGYAKDGQGGLSIVPEQAEIIREIFEAYVDSDKSLRQIAFDLTNMNIPTPSETKGYKKPATAWGLQTVVSMLKNPVYKGTFTYGRYKNYKKESGSSKTHKRSQPESEWLYVAVPIIIEPDLWAKAQKRLAENKDNKRRQAEVINPLRGRIRCKEHRTTFYLTHSGGHSYWYDAFARGNTSVCMKGIKYGLIESQAYEFVLQSLRTPKHLRKVLDEMERDSKTGKRDLESRLHAIKKAYAAEETKQANLLAASIAGTFDKELIAKESAKLEKSRKAIKMEVDSLQAELNSLMPRFSSDELISKWQGMPQSLIRFVSRGELGVQNPSEIYYPDKDSVGQETVSLDDLQSLYDDLDLQVVLSKDSKGQVIADMSLELFPTESKLVQSSSLLSNSKRQTNIRLRVTRPLDLHQPTVRNSGGV